MSVVCPTVTAFDLHEYRKQLEIACELSNRIHIDLMDGDMAPSISPDLSRIWIPYDREVDIHLMYKRPMDVIDKITKIKPSMVIIQAEADVHHMLFASELHKNGIKAGLCVLQGTKIDDIQQIMHSFDQILIFSGNLGHHGGRADLSLGSKVEDIRNEYSDVEIGWDGGINDNNAKIITDMGVDVLNVGGFIQKSKDHIKSYKIIKDTLL